VSTEPGEDQGDSREVRRAVATGDLPPSERYDACRLGGDPWLLVGPEERELIGALSAAGPRLGEVTSGIFTGLQTNADPIYILRDGGIRAGRRLVVDREGRELELEPDLLQPLATGSDVERYALRRLRTVLLFPYRRRRSGEMALMTQEEIEALPLTWQYLCEHEADLRARERGKMDRDGWWGYVYPKSLGLHDRPKLGVAATVKRLEVAADPQGEAYFHNVRVNGILPTPGSIGLFTLLALLNSRPVDFAFRRGAAPLQNGFFTANKQFISWLPIPADPPPQLEDLGRRLHDSAAAIETERSGLLDWIASICGVPIESLNGWTKLAAYASDGREAALAVLDANASTLKIDPRSRVERERIGQELESSAARIAELEVELTRLEEEVEVLAAEAYGLSTEQVARIDAEYAA
jgi:hypothetical protein